jgi:hypothetical protein
MHAPVSVRVGRCRSVLACVAVALWATAASAQPGTPPASGGAAGDSQALLREIAQLRKELDDIRKTYGDRIAALEAQVAAAAAAPAGVPASPVEAVPPALPAPAPADTASAASSKVFNPDIAVIGNVLSTAGRNAVSPAPSVELREAEVSFQAIVDPYARADFFVSFGPDGASLEEGYVTFPTVPGGILLKVGQMRTGFGKLNALHPHVLPWPDRPLVMRNLVGGDEGVSDAGVSVARLIPNPWFFLEATGQVLRGDDSLYHASRSRDLSYVGRLRAYQDVSESANVELGTSYSFGHNDAGSVSGTDLGRFTTRLYGLDATFRYKPLRRSIYRSFVGRAELVWSRRQQADGVQPAFGFYVSGDYQLARRWYAGVRYDRSDRADRATLLDTGVAAVLTYWPSEFSQVRGMFRRTDYAGSRVANELLMQIQFAIGAHGAHPF